MVPETIAVPAWVMPSVLSIVISAIVSFATTYWLKSIDFKNEYYRQILSKRLEAYAFIESQIAVLKTSFLGDDKMPYHALFAYGIDKTFTLQENLHLALSNSMWISSNTIDILTRLNHLFFQEVKEETTNEELIEIGKKNYLQVASLREKLEQAVKNDMKNLHNISKFLNDQTIKGFKSID